VTHVTTTHSPRTDAVATRLTQINQARQALLQNRESTSHVSGGAVGGVANWIQHSWQRCLSQGLRPEHRVEFNAISHQAMARVADQNRALVLAARPVLAQMAHAMAHTRYFALLTDANGVVVETGGPIDRNDRRAALISRIGVDLSEAAVGTTAIGTVLAEQRPVWLHRGEHFFGDTAVYTCAGAPLYGPSGACIGMLDLTGIDVPERPELKHLVTQSARRIENALLTDCKPTLLLHLSWDDTGLGGDADGLVALTADGYVSGTNSAARDMLALFATAPDTASQHCSELFAMPWETLFDMARHPGAGIEIPLWTGMRVYAQPQSAELPNKALASDRAHAVTLHDAQTDLIHVTMAQVRGNVAEAARRLGISRATIYRKLGQTRHGRG
jgi:sigma-54 dependent transcriptional regulator, acetoin dehydrogenase operon transcriptional activator AcoR